MTVATAAVPLAPEQSDQQVALLAKALGHPARVRIMRLLLSRDACYCGELVEELPLAQATISQHALHELVGGLLSDSVELDSRGCD